MDNEDTQPFDPLDLLPEARRKLSSSRHTYTLCLLVSRGFLNWVVNPPERHRKQREYFPNGHASVVLLKDGKIEYSASFNPREQLSYRNPLHAFKTVEGRLFDRRHDQDDRVYFDSAAVFHIHKSRYDAAVHAIERYKKNTPDYKALGNNCVIIANEILTAGGVPPIVQHWPPLPMKMGHYIAREARRARQQVTHRGDGIISSHYIPAGILRARWQELSGRRERRFMPLPRIHVPGVRQRRTFDQSLPAQGD